MFVYQILAGSTDVSVVIRIIDSTDGTPETGVVFNTSGIDIEYRREGAASTDITEATLAALTTAHTDGGFLHIGNGYYRLDLPDAAVASGVTGVLVHGTVTGMVVIGCYIQLVAYNPFDAVRLGLTALPNANASASGGLPILGTNSTAISFTGGMTISASGGSALTSSGSNGHGLAASGNGSGSGISSTGGATGRGILAVGGATSGAGIRAVGTAGNSNAMELAGQGSASGLNATGGATGNGMTLVGGGTSGHGLQATVTSGNEIDADITGAITGNITGNLSGSVGSVTAAVSANVTQFGGTNLTATAGIPAVNLTQWKGSAPADLVSTRVDVTVGAMQSGVITATATAADCIDASALATDAVTEIVNAIKAAVVETEGSYTVQQVLSLILSALAGETTDGGNTLLTPNGAATRIAATVNGSNERTAMTLTPSS
jgi:hypothetical protein